MPINIPTGRLLKRCAERNLAPTNATSAISAAEIMSKAAVPWSSPAAARAKQE
jgi:hypothetical protein